MTVNNNKEITDKNDPAYYDWIPAVLRSTAGFNSCITVGVTSLIFVMTIWHSVSANQGWFSATQIALMLSAPALLSWHFVNARSILATVLSVDESNVEKHEEELPKKPLKIPGGTPLVTDTDIAVEREIFGLSTVLMRAVAGCISVHVICLVSIIFTLTIREAVMSGKVLPGDMEVLIAVLPPMITSWSFMRVANTLGVIVSGGNKLEQFREKLANVIKPSK